MTDKSIKPVKSITEIASFCKENGFIYPNSSIYGGMAGFWDYGPVGCEIKNNIKKSWWSTFVQKREDVVGIDGSTITHPGVWKASGHVDCFTDPLIDCKKCNARIRGDHLIEDTLKIPADGLSTKEITELIKKHKIKCPNCKDGELTNPRDYNLMFNTSVGAIKDDNSIAYLRPETAQVIFADFKLVQKSARLQLPFGIAQMGQAYRNEISPRDFIFRSREFEQMELEYFVHPEKINDCPYLTDKIKKFKLQILTAKTQEKDDNTHIETTISDLLKNQIIKTQWHAYWLHEMYRWFLDLGIKPENIRLREHMKAELSHYSSGTFDIEYKFPFGWKEIHGMADRGQFDLTQHDKFSNEDMKYFDQESGQKIIPYVAAEPSQGVDRAFLAFLIDAYTKENDRFVLKLHPKLAPVQIAILPLMKKDGMKEKARDIFDTLKEEFICAFDERGSIGRRYSRIDEIGGLYCITIDYDTIEDNTVTLRDRDTTEQIRIKTDKIPEAIHNLIKRKKKLTDFGKVIGKG